MSLALADWHRSIPQPFVAMALAMVAVLCGGLIGAERERAHKPAGMRTLVLITLGACLFTQVGLAYASPSRVAGQVVTGVGFLGAGVILRGGGGMLLGVTTAATIWAQAAIGVIAGTGYGGAALAASLLCFVVLRYGQKVEERSRGLCDLLPVRILFDPDGGKTRVLIDDLLDDFLVDRRRRRYREAPPAPAEIAAGAPKAGAAAPTQPLATLELASCRRHRHHREVLVELARVAQVKRIEFAG